MNEQIGLGAFGTFGEPFGYQQVFFLVPALRSNLDLNTNAIEVYPGSELYAVKREGSEGVSSVCCCLYSYAKEPASNRGGTFIGVCVVLRNSSLKGEAIYSLLRELHTDVISNPKNILDNTLQVQKAPQLVVTEPAGLNRIRPIVTTIHPSTIVSIDGSKFLIQAPTSKEGVNPAVAFFDTAIPYFTHTDTLYFTADERIAAYTTEKGIIPAVQWDAFQDYKKQIVQQQKEAAKKATLNSKTEKGQPITKSTKTVTKNQAAKTVTYGLLEPWTNVDTNLSQDAFFKMVQNHNTLLQEYLKLSQQPVVTPAPSNTGNYPSTSIKVRHRIKRKHLMLTILVLTTLLITTSLLLLLRPAIPKEVATHSLSADSTLPVQAVITPPALVPAPNIELTKADVVKLAKDSVSGRKLGAIVDLLFIRNPKNIGEVYLGQKEAYAASLLQLNEKCFRKDSVGAICTCDTLMHIPAFRK